LNTNAQRSTNVYSAKAPWLFGIFFQSSVF